MLALRKGFLEFNYSKMNYTEDVKKKDLERDLYFLKPILTLEEVCKYTGLSKSKMYKHTSSGNIPYYKPEGKRIYFRTEEINEWLLRNRSSSNEEISRKATRIK